MKDSIKLMEIYREMLERSADIIEIVEAHYKFISDPNISNERKNKYKEFRKHAQALIQNLHDDLHILIKIDNEVKELEKDE